jgi:hypothetical protein
MKSGIARGKVVVLMIVLGATIFAFVFSYLQYINNSFPSRIENFDNFAKVEGYSFNGTIFNVSLKWFNSSTYKPLYAQLVSNEYASRVYDVSDMLRADGTMNLPFPVVTGLQKMTGVEVLIAVRNMSNHSDFTIVYNAGNVNKTGA